MRQTLCQSSQEVRCGSGDRSGCWRLAEAGGNQNAFQVLNQTFHIFEARLAQEQGSEAELFIRPNVGQIGPERLDLADELIALGREAAVKALPQLQKMIGS